MKKAKPQRKPRSDLSAKVNVIHLNKTVVQIEWVDSTRWSRWQEHADIERFANSSGGLLISVGIVVGNTEDNLTIVQSISPENKNAAMRIPKVAIKSVKKIGEI